MSIIRKKNRPISNAHHKANERYPNTNANLTSALLLLVFSPVLAIAQTINLTEQQQTNLAITLYNNDLALVQDSRILGPLRPDDKVIVHNVSQQLLTHSLQIHKSGKVLEQSFVSEALSYNTLLKQQLGKKIVLIKQASGNTPEKRLPARLISVDKTTALVHLNGYVETIPLHSNQWRFSFENTLQGGVKQPSLKFTSAGKPHTNNIQINYLSSGLHWKMDYSLTLDKRQKRLNLVAIASLINQTNTVFSNAKISLIEGTLSQEKSHASKASKQKMLARTSVLATPNALKNVHLYNLTNPITLPALQQVQIPLIDASNIPVKAFNQHHINITLNRDKRRLEIQPASFISFTNNVKHDLGLALPAGTAKIFNQGNNTPLKWVSSGHLTRTKKNQRVVINTGKSLDFTIKQRQKSYEQTFNGALITIELKLNNKSNENKILQLSTSSDHPQKIISNTYPAKSKRAESALWEIEVAANSVTVFNLKTRLITKN
jgi:hypothetical protein